MMKEIEPVSCDPDNLDMVDVVGVTSDPMFAVAFFIVLNNRVQTEHEDDHVSPVVNLLAAVGTFSYSLYLTHIPLLVFGETLFPTSDSIDSLVFRYTFYVPLALGFAKLFFFGIERRFLYPPTGFLTAGTSRISTGHVSP